ncbi:MAG: (2Fe-2S) ferredoxin domain-containing protein [Elusimicrobiota bacterium]|nr:(2Fe-2S) ferredoxin domain-containing protein [Elusimicrobiota bacterium]
MEKKPVPYRRTLFVCTHAREEGGRVSCAAPGRAGVAVCEALKEGVKAAGLKGKVRVARSGCLDLCEQGPNAFLYPSGEWFSGLAPEDAPAIVAKLAD